MNYLMAFCIILLGTVFAALTDNKNTYWLFVSDGNVALALIMAWILDKKKLVNIDIIIKRR